MPPDAPPPALTGVLLAGGRSTRFGADKAAALLRGRPLAQWVAEALAAACDAIVVVHARGQPVPPLDVSVPVRCIEDRWEARGPLAGLATAFVRMDVPLCAVASTDVPLLVPGVVGLLAARAEGHDGAVPFVDGHRQPLVACYRPAACAGPFAAHIESGGGSVVGALAGLDIVDVAEAELRAIDPGLRSFRNANTPAALREIDLLLS